MLLYVADEMMRACNNLPEQSRVFALVDVIDSITAAFVSALQGAKWFLTRGFFVSKA